MFRGVPPRQILLFFLPQEERVNIVPFKPSLLLFPRHIHQPPSATSPSSRRRRNQPEPILRSGKPHDRHDLFPATRTAVQQQYGEEACCKLIL